ncbi:MAG TPA: hypothetical protein VEV81_14300 [Pyrinomonadaceae bacterium]|nr:hypothetical protein [Pyrinomonadaceae bacterium]
MKPNPNEEVIDLSELVHPAPPAEQPSPDTTSSGGALELNPHLIEITGRIAQPLRKATLHTFIELHHLLKYSDLIADCVERDGQLGKTALFFRLIKSRGDVLVGKINSFAAQVAGSYATLREALEGISFALEHELSRVYEPEGALDPGAARRGRLSRSELARACGILQNCFQQSTVVLAQVFNPTLDPGDIFPNYKAREEQSIILHRELTLLLQKIGRAERGGGTLQKMYFINSLQQFRQETMHFLMQRDWEEFEGFVDEIVNAYDETGDLTSVLERFTSYLETLIKHVSMRAVFSEDPPPRAQAL